MIMFVFKLRNYLIIKIVVYKKIWNQPVYSPALSAAPDPSKVTTITKLFSILFYLYRRIKEWLNMKTIIKKNTDDL
jgi:hypothetical protein